jgi:hypothetical protein
MTWFKVDDGFYRNAKTAMLSDAATALWLRAATWACDQLTDGFVPSRILPMLRSEADAERELVDAGLWEQMDDGYLFHDWLDYQPSAEEVEALRQKHSEAGRRGGKLSAKLRSEAKPQASAQASAQAKPKQTGSKSEAKFNPVSVSVPVSNTYVLDSVADENPEVVSLCNHLASLIEANGSKRPTIGKQWKDAARLLIDADKRNPAEAHRLIEWCQHDEFWIPNIMSMPKFRKKYDTLRLQAERSNPRSKAQQNQDANEQMVRRYAQDAKNARQAEQLRLGA